MAAGSRDDGGWCEVVHQELVGQRGHRRFGRDVRTHAAGISRRERVRRELERGTRRLR